ncbi:MAG: hypothetical protein U1E05_08400 [Patescibacteria group bacterium]|nr:hypothetical protein [Patescibacteria group bacterium]
MKTIGYVALALLTVTWVTGCGSNSGTPESAGTPAASDSVAESGEALAKEILATFDEVVAEAAKLAEGKPEGATLRPQLEELYATYEPKMADLNVRYLKLSDAEPREFGNANSYLGSNRGKHVTEKDNTLTEVVKYYNLEVGDKETVEVLTSGPVKLLEVAVKR